MNNLLKTLPILMLLSGCGSHLTEKVISTYDDGTPAKVYYYDKHGQWIREEDYYETGALMMEGPIVNEEREGAWTAYFRDGKVQSEGIYEKGLRVGKAMIYHENGHPWMEGNYTADHKCGEWIFYDEQGYEIQRSDFGSCD